MPYVNGYLGKLTKDPVLKQTPSGKQTCNFTIASDKGWGNNKKTDFIPCVAWEKTANTINSYFTKGDSIIVQGEWEDHPWQKNEKGYDIPNWQFVVKSIVFLPKPKAKPAEDDDYVPGYTSTTQMARVNSDNGHENEFAPIDGEIDDLPW